MHGNNVIIYIHNMDLKITNEILDAAIDLYSKGYNIVDIAYKFNLKPNTLYVRLKSKGFALDFRRRSIQQTSTFNEAILLHASGHSFSKISKTLNISYSSLYNFFKKSNLEHTKSIDDLRTGKCVDDYFSVVNTKDKAYILGLLLADGYIYKSNTVNLKLAEKDLDVLEFIRDTLCEGKKLHKDISSFTRAGGGEIISYSLNITSRKMVEDLEKLFIVERKTGKERIPYIPDYLMRHFIRGVFDGDGSISYTNKAQASICCSNLSFLTGLQYIIGYGKIYTSSKNRVVPMHYLCFRSKFDLSNFYTYMYNDGGYKMKRKFVIFNSWYTQHINTEVNK